MRALVVIAALYGLVPGLGDVVEDAVHSATTGHLTHAQTHETDPGHPEPEHSCCVTLHLCGCCAAQPVMQGVEVVSVEEGAARIGVQWESREAVARAPARPFRPPIA